MRVTCIPQRHRLDLYIIGMSSLEGSDAVVVEMRLPSKQLSRTNANQMFLLSSLFALCAVFVFGLFGLVIFFARVKMFFSATL